MAGLQELCLLNLILAPNRIRASGVRSKLIDATYIARTTNVDAKQDYIALHLFRIFHTFINFWSAF